MQKFDVIIIGGGIVGLTLACLLAQDELSVALVDNQAPESSDLKSPYDIRVNAIHHASVAIFNALGIWQQMQQLRVSPYRHMRVWDAGSPAQIEFDSTEISQAYLGYVVEHSVMRQTLWQQLQNCKQVQIYNATPLILREKAAMVEIELDNHQCITASLLVGADGKNSWVAKQAFSKTINHDSQNALSAAALVSTLHTEHPHQQTSLQRFLPTGPVALLPLADPHLVSLVWSTTHTTAESLKMLSEAAFNLQLEQAIEYTLGKLTLCDQRLVFPLFSYQAPQYVKARVALIGDAAHTILPLAGQGLNLGLLDAACLAQTIVTTHTKERDIGEINALRRYERWRKGENTGMLLAMEGFNRFFSSTLETARHVRHIAFELTQRLPWTKKYFMQYGMGLRGELPDKAKVNGV